MLVLLFTRIRVTELKIFMIFNHIILSSKHLLVQTQQKKHQKKVWNMFGVNNKNARKASMSCLFLVFHFEQVNVSCSLGLWRLVINFWNSININVFFFQWYFFAPRIFVHSQCPSFESFHSNFKAKSFMKLFFRNL